MEDVKGTLRQFILTHYLPGELPDNVRDDTALQTSGILDSLAVLAVASFAEQTYGVELTAFDTTPEQFDRIEDIASLIALRRQTLTA